MSIIDHCTISAKTGTEMQEVGASLARSIYVRPLTIILSGSLGAGKTTFTQGLAAGLGIQQRIVSPTFALEQRYGNALCHIDLYRLNDPKKAQDILDHSHEFPGIRIIEWAERADRNIDAGITIAINDNYAPIRTLECSFRDIAIPTDREIEQWMNEMMLPENVRRHTAAVADVSERIAKALIGSGRIVRPLALRAAALGHDLLRFLNFHSPLPGEPVPTKEQLRLWDEYHKRYPPRHEEAASQFFSERGYPGVGEIIRTHQGKPEDMDETHATTEQLILAYADKRIIFDKQITLNDRFAYLTERYGKGPKEKDYEQRRKSMETVEHWLFPDGTPF